MVAGLRWNPISSLNWERSSSSRWVGPYQLYFKLEIPFKLSTDYWMMKIRIRKKDGRYSCNSDPFFFFSVLLIPCIQTQARLNLLRLLFRRCGPSSENCSSHFELDTEMVCIDGQILFPLFALLGIVMMKLHWSVFLTSGEWFQLSDGRLCTALHKVASMVVHWRIFFLAHFLFQWFESRLQDIPDTGVFLLKDAAGTRTRRSGCGKL